MESSYTQNHGVNFYSSDGDWEIIDSYIANSGRKGVEAGDTTATWSITTTTVEGTDEVLIEASGAAGHWEIHESNLQTGGEALNATEATRGNASHNYWGSGDGPSGAFSGSGGAVVGNLTVKPYYIDIGLTTLNTDNNPDSGISVANDLQGNGTEVDPYVVQNITGLQVIETDLAANYTLGTDINASPLADGKGFDPIGNESAPFTGRFDGQDHTIRGLSINRPGTDNIGLFGFIEGAVVQDVTLRNVNITGGRRTGGLIGWNIGTVRNVSVAGQVNGTYNVGGVAGQNSELVTQASASGRVNGIEAVGGLVGLNFELRSTIKESYATARVNGSQDVGGLVGVNVAFTVIRQAYSTGQVTGTEAVGGLVGRNDRGADISYTYAAGQVNGSTAVGGLVGRTGGGATVTSSYWDINTSGQSSSADNATSLTTAEMIGNTAEQNMAGFEFGSMWRTIIGDYPRLAFSKDATALPPVVGNNQPTDPDGDGKYDDITGDGTTNILGRWCRTVLIA